MYKDENLNNVDFMINSLMFKNIKKDCEKKIFFKNKWTIWKN